MRRSLLLASCAWGSLVFWHWSKRSKLGGGVDVSAFTIRCPICRTDYPVPTELVGVDESTNKVLVRMDRTNLYGHMRACAAEHHQPPPAPDTTVMARRVPPGPVVPTGPTKAELSGRIDQMLRMRAFVQEGASRACTMCGANGQDCLVQLEKRAAACCAACHNGDTHPVPKGDLSCAEWGAEHGVKS